jgi:hypothetical protein
LSEAIIESVSQVKKWNEYGRRSILQDVQYLRSRIEDEKVGKVKEFDLIEEFIKI